MDRETMVEKLRHAICQFAKRQDTWFRGMERRGSVIHWVDEADYDSALSMIGDRFSEKDVV
jgi:tRNA A37 N6-isopentenylltransferase MiaA